MLQRTNYAMHPDTLDDYLALQREVMDAKRGMSADEMRENIAAIYEQAQVFRESDAQTEERLYTVDRNRVAHIPVMGVLTPAANPCAALFGDAETEYGFIKEAIAQAELDHTVQSVDFDIDSPGGYVDGVDETGMIIASMEKPTRAVVHNMAASAAYWLATQADEIVAASPAATVGSIGVAIETVDMSEAEQAQGVKRRVFTSTDAPDKRIDLSNEEGQQKIVARLDDLHAIFARRVAEGRGVSVETVNTEFGRGGIVIAEKAAEVGMIDSVINIKKYDEQESVGVADESIPASEAVKSEVPMDREQLKKESPDLYNALVNESYEAGMKAERERVNALKSLAATDPDNEKLQEVVSEAVENGASAQDSTLLTKINVAIRDGKKLEGENPPAVATESADADSEDNGAQAMIDKLKKLA